MKITKYIRKQALVTFVCCVQLCFSLTGVAYAAPEWPELEADIEAEAGIVMDVDSGAVLYQKNPDSLYLPASTTKVLTAMLVLENCDNLDDTVTFSHTAMERVESDSGVKMDIVEGDQMSVRDCLYALLLQSSNETANALAEYVAGDIDSFVEMMNDKARELGLSASHFDNPSGLNGDRGPDGNDTQLVTARELALIAKAAYQIPELLEINKAKSHRLPPLANHPDGPTITTENRLLQTAGPIYYPAAVAGKTGWLKASGNTLILYAEQDGRRLIATVLKGFPSPRYYNDARAMLEFCFSNFTNHDVSAIDAGDFTEAELETLKGKGMDVDHLEMMDGAAVTLPNGASLETAQRRLSGTLPAGHPDGAMAMIEYAYNGHLVGTSYISSTGQAQAVAPVPTTQAEPTQAATAAETVPGGATGIASFFTFPNAYVPIAVGGGVLVVLGIILVTMIQRRKEAKRMEERRRNRRRRLQELGISQEEFDKMLESRKQSRNK